MEFESAKQKEFITCFDALNVIEREVQLAILPLWSEDPQAAELNEEIERDYKEAQYLLLDWLKRSCSPRKVLYAGSGSDIMPKYVFGEDRVFHTSLEDYYTDKTNYYLKLGDGIKIVADNANLPFPDTSFDIVMFFGLQTESTRKQLVEATRVLNEGGLAVCDCIVSDSVDLTEIFHDYERVKVPDCFQNRGVSETNFSIFRKN